MGVLCLLRKVLHCTQRSMVHWPHLSLLSVGVFFSLAVWDLLKNRTKSKTESERGATTEWKCKP